MDPKISNYLEEDNVLRFTLKGVNVSFANGIRRVILSDIPVVAFKTIPYEQNKIKINTNTSRFNNEIVKQRLSCIPICIQDLEMKLSHYILEINEENNTDTIMWITTEHFKIKNLITNTYLDTNDVRKIFPPFIPSHGNGSYFIDFLRLRPKLSANLLGEKINLTCEFSIGTAREDSSYNITGTCAYGFTPDVDKIKTEVEIRKQKWKDENKTVNEINNEAENWKLLEGLRYVINNSYDFVISSVGIYENTDIIFKACDILIDKFKSLETLLKNDEVSIKPSISTIEHSYDVTLENEDYTVGNILNYVILEQYYNNLNVLSFIGFKKFHPHDTDSILTMAFNLTDQIPDTDRVKNILYESIENIKQVFEKIKILIKK